MDHMFSSPRRSNFESHNGYVDKVLRMDDLRKNEGVTSSTASFVAVGILSPVVVQDCRSCATSFPHEMQRRMHSGGSHRKIVFFSSLHSTIGGNLYN